MKIPFKLSRRGQCKNGIPVTAWDVGARGQLPENWSSKYIDLDVHAFDADETAISESKVTGEVTWWSFGLAKQTGEFDFYNLNTSTGSSLYKPHQNMNQFNRQKYSGVKNISKIYCKNANDAISKSGVPIPKLLKIDTQGSELEILMGFTSDQLSEVLMIEVEVEFMELYVDQPLFCELNSWLNKNGFEILDLRTHRAYHSAYDKELYYLNKLGWNRPTYKIGAQLVAGDALYIRKSELITNELDKVKFIWLLVMYSFFEFALFFAENQLKGSKIRNDIANEVIRATPKDYFVLKSLKYTPFKLIFNLLNNLFTRNKIFYVRRNPPDL
jgi:FkbM family methyltransferase